MFSYAGVPFMFIYPLTIKNKRAAAKPLKEVCNSPLILHFG